MRSLAKYAAAATNPMLVAAIIGHVLEKGAGRCVAVCTSERIGPVRVTKRTPVSQRRTAIHPQATKLARTGTHW